MKKTPTTRFSPRLFSAISALLATALPVALSAAIPQHWTVETSRVQPAQFEAYHGETIEFAATMQTCGKPLAITTDLIGIYWQTNGMGSAYWTAPAVLSNNVMIARWTPEMDVGANVYSCFIGSPGEIYRAAFQLRLRPSPGAVPSELPLPVKTLDFAQVQVLNPPYYSKSETDAKIIELAPAPGNYAIVSNLAMTAVQPAAISDMATKSDLAGKIDVEYSPYESSTNRFEWTEAGFKVTAGRWGHLNYHEEEGVHIQFEDTFLTLLPQDAGQIVWRYPRGNKGGCLSLPSKNGVLATTSDLPTDSTISGWGYIKSYSETDPTVDGKISTHNSSSSAHADIRQSVSAKYSKPSSGIPKTDLASAVQTSLGKADSAVQPAAISDMETQTHAAATYQPKGSYLTSESDPTVDGKLAPIETIVSAWQTYWDGDDVRVTVTNYYGSQDLPSLYIEQKISDGGTNYYKTIWTEKARLNVIFDRLLQLESDVATKADRAWGYYDSHAGTYSPDGFTSISSESILISKDMSYQKTVTSGGEVWVLTATDPTVITGAETNGFFRISDSEGNSIFEVVKGDKRIAPATVSSVTVGGNSLTINFNVESAAHPSLEICSDLVDADWKAEDEASCPATVVWSGTSGSYVATVTGKAAMPKMFVKGTYEVGGETYARHGVPLGFDRVVIGGVFYRVAVETVSGKKLMTLTEL